VAGGTEGFRSRDGDREQVCERLEELVAAGANHLLLNPISRYAEQLEAVAELADLK
jgi:hypothetical protein